MFDRNEPRITILASVRPYSGVVRIEPSTRVSHELETNEHRVEDPPVRREAEEPRASIKRIVQHLGDKGAKKDAGWKDVLDMSGRGAEDALHALLGGGDLPIYLGSKRGDGSFGEQVPNVGAELQGMLAVLEDLMGKGSSGLPNYGIPVMPSGRGPGGWSSSTTIPSSQPASSQPASSQPASSPALPTLEQLRNIIRQILNDLFGPPKPADLRQQESQEMMDRTSAEAKKAMEGARAPTSRPAGSTQLKGATDTGKIQPIPPRHAGPDVRGDVGKLPISVRLLVRLSNVVSTRPSRDPGYVDPIRSPPRVAAQSSPSATVAEVVGSGVSPLRGPSVLILRQGGHDVIDFAPGRERVTPAVGMAPLRRFILPDPITWRGLGAAAPRH